MIVKIIKSIKYSLINGVLYIMKTREDLFGRLPVKGAHGEIVVGSFPYGQLLFKIFKGIKSVRSVNSSLSLR